MQRKDTSIMFNSIVKLIKEKEIRIFDIAVMSDDGIESMWCNNGCNCMNSYSIAKLMIGTAIGLLSDEGALSIDQYIVDVLSSVFPADYDHSWDKVTIRNALTHRTGLNKGIFDIDRCNAKEYGNDYLKYVLSYGPANEPGKEYFYSDVPHYILSRIVSEITGIPADAYIKEAVFDNIGFDQTGWARCPQGYTVGSSGLFANAEDLVKLAWLYKNKGVFNGKRIISEEWIETAEREHFDLNYINGTGFIGKTGMNGQMLMYNREKNIAVAWHGYELKKKDRIIANYIEEHLE